MKPKIRRNNKIMPNILNSEKQAAVIRSVERVTGIHQEEASSFGSFEGRLDEANIHDQKRRFWIYPTIGPRKVMCDFMPGTKDQIKEAMGHFVRVVGMKFFRASSPYPVRIKVKDFEVINLQDRISIESLKGIATAATSGMSSVEFVRQIRDEWD